jgi:hypothetical protein
MRDKFIVLAILLAGMIAFIELAGFLARREPGSGPPAPPGSGIAYHVQVETIYLHPTFVALAKLPARSAAIRSHDALRAYLKSCGSEAAWYAITTRSFAASGITTLTSYSRPYSSPGSFAQFVDVLAASAGKPPSCPEADYSTARVVVIPDDLARRQPREVIAELLELTVSPAEGDH